MSRIPYRLWQLRRALRPALLEQEAALVAATLAPEELRLFVRMARFDQRHALDVLLALHEAGEDDPALLRAALLHDCGKVDDRGRPIPLLYYGLFVMLLRLAPALYRRAAADGRWLLRPFAAHAAHEARAALLAERAGSDAATVAILRDYAAGRATPQIAALRRADDAR